MLGVLLAKELGLVVASILGTSDEDFLRVGGVVGLSLKIKVGKLEGTTLGVLLGNELGLLLGFLLGISDEDGLLDGGIDVVKLGTSLADGFTMVGGIVGLSL